MADMSREEMEKAIEKAQREWQETLAKMTPEEREQAMRRAQQAVEADQAANDQLLADAAALLGGSAPKQQAKFCTHCGAEVNPGKFCIYCGMAYES